MRFTSMHIENFLSFQSFPWQGLDPRLNIVVGPNNVGKTNLIRALQVVVSILTAKGHRWPEWEAVVRHVVGAEAFRISLGLAFTTNREKDLIRVFFATALSSSEDIRQALQAVKINAEPREIGRWADFLLERMEQESLAWLNRGTLTVSYERGGFPRARYSGSTEGLSWAWDLLGPHASSLARDEQHDGVRPSIFAAWLEGLPEQDRSRLADFLAGRGEDAPSPNVREILLSLKSGWSIGVWACD